MSDDLNTDQLSWAEAAAAASSFHRVVRAAAKIEAAAAKAAHAEAYIRKVYADKEKVEAKLVDLKAEMEKYTDQVNHTKADTAEQIAAMDAMVRTRQNECDQWVRDAENNARKSIDALDKAKHEATQNLDKARAVMQAEVAAEMQPLKDQHHAEIQQLEVRIGDLRSQVRVLDNEKSRLHAVLEEARNKFAALNV